MKVLPWIIFVCFVTAVVAKPDQGTMVDPKTNALTTAAPMAVAPTAVVPTAVVPTTVAPVQSTSAPVQPTSVPVQENSMSGWMITLYIFLGILGVVILVIVGFILTKKFCP
ncbi:unnamed protein product [Chironomus riparius]|uniref:Uncharacterized protein n=1 Tax=Chironomus riparius TaxID=315576 RepID=A0A9N9RJ34_9DIPT|nr:unnamed protein product [Chironomus riparius]